MIKKLPDEIGLDEQNIYVAPLCIMLLGQIHVELVLDSGITTAFLTPLEFSVPKFQWVRLIIAAHQTQVSSPTNPNSLLSP